jgi:4-aminobutyrate aminotransferase/(S)-3-amino-2-methylpropionate transaminase
MENAKVLARLQAVECRDSTYIPHHHALVFHKAQGSRIWDVEGKEYIDLCAGFGVHGLGHASSAFRKVVAEYAAASSEPPFGFPLVHAMGDVYPSQDKIELLEKLKAVLPTALCRGMLALTGGQAVELAIKTAIISKKRSGFIAFKGAYHGLDLGILPFCSRGDFKEPFTIWSGSSSFNVMHLDWLCDEEAIKGAIGVLQGQQSGFCGIIVEPVQGRSGIKPAPLPWLQKLHNIVRKYDGVLIFDEIFSGLGRTGTITHAEEVSCDLLCLGKALGGGLPLSACFGTEEVMRGWPENKGEAIHTGTFFGHPLSCRTATQFLNALVHDDLCRNAQLLGDAAQRYLAEQLSESRIVKEVRGKGLMIGVEFYQEGLGAACMDEMRAQGVILLANGEKGEGVSITPALNIPQELLLEALKRLVEWVKSQERF